MKTSLLATLALGAAVLPAQDREFGTPVPTTLSSVRAEPDAFRNVKIEFDAQFASLGKISNPFFTRFTPADYMNLYVWADEQPIWQQKSYEDMFGYMFYSKLGDQLQDLFKLRRYQRIRVQAIVRNTFQGTPWIEVMQFETLPEQVDVPTLVHLSRGEQFMSERKWQRAIAELTLAPGPGVPAAVQSAAYRNLGICYLRIGEAQQAVKCLRNAVELAREPDYEMERLLATAEARPGLELDRTVGTEGLRDHERPMWEAFEKSNERVGQLLR